MRKKTKKRENRGSPDAAGAAHVVLGAMLDMRAARELKQRLTESLVAGGPCVIDGSKVDRVSTGCLQILASFVAAMAAADRCLTVSNPSRALVDGYAMLGLSEHFAQFRQEH